MKSDICIRIIDPQAPIRISSVDKYRGVHRSEIVRGIILDEKERPLLLERREGPYRNWLNLPGGKLESGELPVQGIIREVLEETALQCSSNRYLYTVDDSRLGRHFANHYFLCLASGKISLNEESTKYSWIRWGDIHRHRIAFHGDLALQLFQLMIWTKRFPFVSQFKRMRTI